MEHSIENFQLHAYLDGELTRKDCAEIEQALEHDEALLKNLESLSLLKQNMKKSYENLVVPEPKMSFSNKESKAKFFPKSAVASLFLGIILGSGITVYSVKSVLPSLGIQQQHTAKYLVHLDSNDINKQKQALQKIEALFTESDEPVQVDLISHYHGIDLLDVNNPNNAKLQALLDRYDNLTVLACKRALDRAHKAGKPINIMHSAIQDKVAVDRLAKRLRSGWSYIKI